MKIFFSAGEPSGDALGAAVIKALPPGTRVSGIGGEEMQAAGVASLFSLSDLAVMGLVEVLPRLPRLFRRLRETVAAVLQTQPDIVCTIDAPGFNARLARRLHAARAEGKWHGKLVHLVAPSVWAWKPGRAAKMAAIYDHLLCLLPFEPPLFEKHGLASTFVGHPILEKYDTISAQKNIHSDIAMDKEKPLLLLLPGSRRGEVSRLLPLFLEAAQRVQQHRPDTQLALMTVPFLKETVQAMVKKSQLAIPVLTDSKYRVPLYRAADAALAASGTVSVELAAAGTPHVVAYRVHPLTHQIAKRLITIRFASLINILENNAIIPEYLQHAATPNALAEAVAPLFVQKQAFAAAVAPALAKLRPPEDSTGAGHAAAKVLLSLVR
ncbi:MAG: lipid-A-disaccharide synthase [Holosporales bacterium]|jgi:lipid-A-disaccharide synthase